MNDTTPNTPSPRPGVPLLTQRRRFPWGGGATGTACRVLAVALTVGVLDQRRRRDRTPR